MAIERQWHRFKLNERHAPWKIFLPVSRSETILAVGLKGCHLASLARSWEKVYLYLCTEHEKNCALIHGQILGQDYIFEKIKNLNDVSIKFAAVAVESSLRKIISEEILFELLKPGGSVLYVGNIFNSPKNEKLKRIGYEKISRYALLPPKTGKVIIPIGDQKETLLGLKLYSPRKLFKYLCIEAYRIATSIGLGATMTPMQVIVAKKRGNINGGSYLLDWLKKKLKCNIINVTVYTGWTKLILQLIDVNKRIVGIAKLSDISVGMKEIHHENNVILSLYKCGDLRRFIPEITLFDEWSGHVIQVQSAVSVKKNYSRKFSTEHKEFLDLLGSVNKYAMTLENWPIWEKNIRWVDKCDPSIFADAIKLREELVRIKKNFKNILIPFHRMHGDFTPSNVLIEGKKIKVVDWDRSEKIGPPLFDAINYMLCQSPYFKKNTFNFKQYCDGLAYILKNKKAVENLLSKIDEPENIIRLSVLFCFLLNDPIIRDHLR